MLSGSIENKIYIIQKKGIINKLHQYSIQNENDILRNLTITAIGLFFFFLII
jgi:hypothetical protein